MLWNWKEVGTVTNKAETYNIIFKDWGLENAKSHLKVELIEAITVRFTDNETEVIVIKNVCWIICAELL